MRKRLFFSRSLYLNTTGNEYYDGLAIEYNSILIDSSIKDKMLYPVLSDTICFLNNFTTWDELFIPGATEQTSNILKTLIELNKGKFNLKVERNEKTYYVDLNEIRNNGFDYYSLLSRNRRKKIKRHIKEYEKKGKIKIVEAEDKEAAILMLESLADLNQHTWIYKGKSSSFSNKFFLN